MADKKKTWTEPELIVIVRGKPEEGVLWLCKDEFSGGGSGGQNGGCWAEVGGCLSCDSSAGS